MNPLEVLELKPGCTKEDVKKNFRRLSFLYHPDKHPNDKRCEEAFKRIVNAYEIINKEPSSFIRTTTTPIPGDTIYGEIEATIEDLYFERSKTVDLKRIIPCQTCLGLGTKDIEHGLCLQCKGTGHINNKVLHMMKRSSVCPSCNGIGIKKEHICVSCNGKKTTEEIKTYRFRLNLKSYINKCLVLNGEGNQFPYNHEGDVIIKLKIKEDPTYKIENDMLCLNFSITPVQYLIGDTCEVTIYGKLFKFKVPTVDNRIILEDKRKEFSHPHRILIKTFLSAPVINGEIRKLYEKILILEKKATSSSESALNS